ncbi:YitT family protein [Desulfosporosinus sp. SB140]|uniref:YitT family protein n=1 Tax=Desulfosporosinus paludis TaxID=3115649 RepID=UPI00388FB505
MTRKRNKLVNIFKKYAFLLIGSILAAIALEIFLVPNDIVDGGITGISIMASHLTKLPLGAYIFTLNIPFLVLGYYQIGKTFVLSTLFSITTLSIGVSILQPVPGLTNDILLAAVFGGIILGIGVGLVVRYGGSLDGTEIVAIVVSKQTGFSVGEVVMFFNIFILSSAGLLFGWDRAMYSLIAYFVAFKVIDLTIQGLDESKAVMIVSEKPDEISSALLARLGRGVTFLEGKGGYSGQAKGVVYSVITRLEIAKLKSIIDEIDEDAFVTIHDVHDVIGGKLKKKAIH